MSSGLTKQEREWLKREVDRRTRQKIQREKLEASHSRRDPKAIDLLMAELERRKL